MNKILVIAMLLILTMAAPVCSADFKVHGVRENPKEAVLVDNDTGEEWHVKEGDRVNGAIVREIRRSHVTIVTPVDETEAVAVVIPTMAGSTPVQENTENHSQK